MRSLDRGVAGSLENTQRMDSRQRRALHRHPRVFRRHGASISQGWS